MIYEEPRPKQKPPHKHSSSASILVGKYAHHFHPHRTLTSRPFFYFVNLFVIFVPAHFDLTFVVSDLQDYDAPSNSKTTDFPTFIVIKPVNHPDMFPSRSCIVAEDFPTSPNTLLMNSLASLDISSIMESFASFLDYLSAGDAIDSSSQILESQRNASNLLASSHSTDYNS
jgi:hypothetical protein